MEGAKAQRPRPTLSYERLSTVESPTSSARHHLLQPAAYDTYGDVSSEEDGPVPVHSRSGRSWLKQVGASFASCCFQQQHVRRLESGYLTLIPLSDDRLKPRRTKLVVVISLLLCLVSASAVFFLVPRGVTMGNISVYSSHMSFNTSKSTYQIILTATIPIYNPNWLPIKVMGTVNVLFYDQIAGSTYLEPVIVPARTTPMNHTLDMDASSVPQKYLFTIYTQCFTFPEQLIFFLSGKLKAKYLGQMIELPEIDSHFIIQCNTPSPPPKPAHKPSHPPDPPPLLSSTLDPGN